MRMKYFFRNLNLAKKFALIFALALSVICLTGISVICFITDKYNQELYAKTQLAMDFLVTDLETSLKEIAVTTDYLIENQQIQQALTQYHAADSTEEKARSKRLLYDNLYSYFNSDTAIESIVLMLGDGSFVRMGYSSWDYADEAFKALESASDQAMGRLVWQGGSDFENTAFCARQIRQKAYLKLDKLATLFVEVNMEKIISQSQRAREACLVFDTGGDFLYYPNPFPEEIAPCDYPSSDSYQVIHSSEGVYFAASGSLPYTGWSYTYFFDYEDLFSQLNNALWTALFVLVLVFFVVVAAEYALVRRITSHFRTLEEKMRYFESGALEPLPVSYDYSTRNDEIGLLHRRFDQTVLNYKKLVHDNYRKQLLLKDAAIRNLEQQIHPHFLYNVLDSIYLLAEAHGVPDIADMSHSLACLFRASISDSAPTIPIRNELDYLDSYIHIQLLRFRELIHFSSSLDEPCLDVMIPKLSIQPLVENAIKHSIEETGESCRIVLTISDQDKGTYISVSNTGSRFEDDMELRLRHPKQSLSNTLEVHGIGLRNINERLQLIYGEQCCLHFYNNGPCAVVYFIIPKGDS